VVCLSPRLRYEMNIGDANRVCVSFLSGLFIQQEYNTRVCSVKKKITLMYGNSYTTV
jgi:hypothetical protein